MSGQLHRRLAALEAARAHHRPYLAARAAAEQATPAVTVLESPDPAPGAELALPVVGQRYNMRPERGTRTRTVTITRVWDTDTGPAVAYKWRDGQPRTCRSACPVGVFHQAYEPEEPPNAPAPAPALSDGERSFLAFALDLASDHMASRGDGFGDDDWATLASLRKLAGGGS